MLTGDPELFTKATLRMGIDLLVAQAKVEVSRVVGLKTTADKKVTQTQASITRDNKTIKDDEHYMKHHPWDFYHLAVYGKKVADLKVAVVALKATLKLEQGAASLAKLAVDQANSALADVNKRLLPLIDVPTTLQTLAHDGNPAMLGWLDEWKTQGLNIIIMDWSRETDFLERVQNLNRAVAKGY